MRFALRTFAARGLRAGALLMLAAWLVACGGGGRPDAAPADGCEFGCLDWQSRCDTDPRGVSRCERRCMRTGRICPPEEPR